jgi:chromate transporter
MELRRLASRFLKCQLPEATMAASQIPVAPAQKPAEASLVQFALYFLRLGSFGFGGPIALVGYMQKDLVEERQWIAQQDYLDGLAFSQLAPGPLAAQLAMYLGFVRAGLWGATVVGVAFILPSFLMVVAIGEAYVHFGGTNVIAALFYGIGAAVIGIIARSAMKLVKTSLKKDWLLWGVFFVLALTTAITERENVWLFLAAGFLVILLRTPPSFWRRQHAMYILAPFSLTLSKAGALFAFFLKASLFVFGSGLAIVPFLHGGVVQEHHWLTETQFLDAVAVAMITPGPVVITAAFVGYLVAGFPGACAAALGVFLPVYLFVILAGPFYKRFSQNKPIRSFVQGVTAAATGAIAGAVVVLAKHSVRDFWTLGIAVATFLILTKWKIPEPVVIVLAGALGVALSLR